MHTYKCSHCGGVFDSERSDEDAQQESVSNFGVRGDAPREQTPQGQGMAVVCDDCYEKFMGWYHAGAVQG
jgi:hypothetical protein